MQFGIDAAEVGSMTSFGNGSEETSITPKLET